MYNRGVSSNNPAPWYAIKQGSLISLALDCNHIPAAETNGRISLIAWYGFSCMYLAARLQLTDKVIGLVADRQMIPFAPPPYLVVPTPIDKKPLSKC